MSLHAPTTAPATTLPPGRAHRRRAALGTLLLTLTALPAAVLVVPDATVNVVPAAADALDLRDPEVPGLLRATGLSLPALLVAVPLAAVAARRYGPWPVLALGLAALLTGLGAVPLVDSVPLTGTVRTIQGAGAGTILPACLVLVWERRSPILTAAFAGALTSTLLLAAPLTLAAVPPPAPDWHRALAPYQWPAVAAAVATLAHLLLRGRGQWTLPPSRHTERGQLLLPLVPSAGFAFLAVVAAPDWSPGAQLTVAALAIIALLGLALTAARDTTAGSPSGCALVMIATGLLTHPTTGPLAATEATTLPFVLAAATALLGALTSPFISARQAIPTGYALAITAITAILLATPDTPWTLAAPLAFLGTGTGLTLAASLRDTNVSAALFSLSLCFPAVLAGQLAVLSLQAAQLEAQHPQTDAQRLDALQDGFHVWLAAAGAIAVVLAAATLRHARKAAANPQPR
ncbi:hypothetical protein GCM10022254_35750 [Actinomadura meridiana]|uniref:MFS transporter n=1 Tax=Actinomadura meridiana TaxID=559626 RepID=A0ABP8C4S9_9ACTN